MKALLVILLFASTRCLSQDTTQQIIAGRYNDVVQQQKPYVILISADGFRYDFAEKFNAKNLLQLGKSGVTADFLQPCFPSLTFPNHYSIATGLYPAHNGIVDNSFYDRKTGELYSMNDKEKVTDAGWYGGIPLWVLAEQQHMLTASYYWVASETSIQNILTTYYYIYNNKTGIDQRIQAVVNWLALPEDKRPHLVTFYFPEVDHEAHDYGPGSEEAGRAVRFVDESIGKLVAAVGKLNLPVNFIFVSDHGMLKVDNKRPVILPAAVDTNKFIIPAADAFLQLYAKDSMDVQPAYIAIKKQAKDFDVYLPSQTPGYWHYSKKDDWYNRIGDLLLVPHKGKIFKTGSRKIPPGKHGFDPAITEMHASFMAWGPAFKSNYRIGGFENIHIYPLIANILGLEYNHTIDGDFDVLKPILK